MSYQVIARKYRPLTFADLTGQEHISRTLKNALENQRLHHAYLFSGVRGTGKTTSARILAKGLNCLKGVTSEPCLQCPSCLEIAVGNSLDVIEIDAASNTGVDNVREVIVNNISIAPARDRYKVFIIDEVHMLSNQAFNALLKTLEEPPAHVVFMMATTELHKVPDTILSRCQQFEFRHIPAEKIFQRLREIATAEQVNIKDEALREVSRAGNGSLRDAQSALDQVISFSGKEISEQDVIHSLGLVSTKILLQATSAIAEQNTAELLKVVEELDSSGHDLRYFTRELMTYFRHLLVIKSGLASSDVLGISDAEIAHLQQLAPQFSEEDIVRFFHLLTEVEKQIKDSPQPRFQLEIGLVKLAQITRLRSLNEVLQRIEELSAKVSGGSIQTPTMAPLPAKPTSAPRPSPLAPQRMTAPEPVATASSYAMEEPPGFTDAFDQNPPSVPLAEFSPASPLQSEASPPSPTRPSIKSGHELGAIRSELEKRRKTLIVMALEEAQVQYEGDKLTATFAAEDAFSKRLQESTALFREIGEQLFGQAIQVVVKFSHAANAATPAQEAKQAHDLMLEGAKANPAVKALLDTFRGEIIDVQQVLS